MPTTHALRTQRHADPAAVRTGRWAPPTFRPALAEVLSARATVQAALAAAGVQRKAKVGAADDAREREADQVAEQVMRMAAPGAQASPDAPRIQHACAAAKSLDRKCSSCSGDQEELRRRSAGGDAPAPEAPASVGEIMRSDTGTPLDAATRAYFEPRFQRDFSAVRVHTGQRAAASASDVNALAYTMGSHVVFGADRFAPGSAAGRRLLAHELTHVVQAGVGTPLTRPDHAGAGGPGLSPTVPHDLVQRQPAARACPARPAREAAQSRTPAGILPVNVTAGPNRVDVQDFAVNSDALPPDVTNHADWQRAMSIIAGDPTIDVMMTAFTDCVGNEVENVSLRRTRIDSVLRAMPPAARARVPFTLRMAIQATTFLDTNLTPEGRAHNRAVRISWISSPPRGQQPCDVITGAAATMDQYIFLVSCVESRLGLTSPTQAPTVLSILRQIYYGTSSWSASPNPVWRDVINAPSWSPGTDPTPRLGVNLMNALCESQVVEGTDMGHLFTGIDAMLSPHTVTVSSLPRLARIFGLGPTTLPNEEWATWAGDVGSAAAMFTIGQTYAAPGTTLDPATSFSGYASDADLRGDTDAFAMRSGFNPGGSPASRLGQAIHLSGTLSEDIRQYYRMTSTVLGAARSSSAQRFVEAYGGVIAGGVLTNRPALIAALRPSVDEFARLFMGQELLSRGYLGSAPPRPGAPDPSTLIGPAVDTMTDRFVTWLERQLSVTPAAPSPAPPRSSPSARRCTHLRPPTR